MVLAQVLIRRRERSFELRHAEDRGAAKSDLHILAVFGLRDLAQFTAGGAFRPLKAAPNLRRGWRADAANDLELEMALSHLYPGAIADRFAARQTPPPVTDYRPFTARQSGMYRVTTKLNDDQAAEVTHACCHRRFCLKQRLWTATGLAPDSVAEKSLIPCLEPCAVFLEFARKAARIEQEDKISIGCSPSDLETIVAALEREESPDGGGMREADFGEPTNPRRVQRMIERLRKLAAAHPASSGGGEG